MYQLAHDPIGKETAASTADVAKMLNSLPRGVAFVRAGDDVEVTYTHNAPSRVSQAEHTVRLQTIYGQTRAKYCHSRAEVEQQLLTEADDSAGGAQLDNPDDLSSGW